MNFYEINMHNNTEHFLGNVIVKPPLFNFFNFFVILFNKNNNSIVSTAVSLFFTKLDAMGSGQHDQM